MPNVAPETGNQKEDPKGDRQIVQEAVDNLLDKSKSHGGITLGHIWTILFHRYPFRTAGKILGMLVVLMGIGWTAHIWYRKVFPEETATQTVERVDMANVLDARTEYTSDKAPDWLYPLVEKLEGDSRTALQVTVQFQDATQGAQVELISSAAQLLTGFAFLVRKAGEGESYQPLPRLKDESLQFVVDVPAANPGDRLLFLTSVAGSVTDKQLRGLFTVRRADK